LTLPLLVVRHPNSKLTGGGVYNQKLPELEVLLKISWLRG